MLTVVETHPVQYHAPVYRMLKERFDVPVTAIYGSGFSVSGYRDPEFGVDIAWDTDLLSGYSSIFLSDIHGNGLAKTLRGTNPKAVLILGYDFGLYRAAFDEALKNHYPILFRGETTDHARKRSLVKSWARDILLRWMYMRCDRLLYIGERSRRHFKRLRCPDEKLTFSPYSVDTAPFILDEKSRKEFRVALRESLDIPEDRTVLLFSGKLSRRKGPDLLLQALKEAPAEIRNRTTVLFVGDGELKRELQDSSEKSPQVKTVFAGFRNQTELSRYYHASDLLVLPSRYLETWGLVVNEALHHGLPCIVSEEVGCLPDLIDPGVTGEICRANSVSSLASAIQRGIKLIDNPGVRTACLKKAADYRLEKTAESIAEAYAAVAGGKR